MLMIRIQSILFQICVLVWVKTVTFSKNSGLGCAVRCKVKCVTLFDCLAHYCYNMILTWLFALIILYSCWFEKFQIRFPSQKYLIHSWLNCYLVWFSRTVFPWKGNMFPLVLFCQKPFALAFVCQLNLFWNASVGKACLAFARQK